MSKYIFVAFLGLMILQTLSAQTSKYFINTYNWNRTDYFADIYVKPDSTYFLSGTTVNPPDVWYTQSTIINNRGEILYNTDYKYDTLNNANGMINPIGENFILSPYTRNLERTDVHGHFLVVDSIGNIIQSDIVDTIGYDSFFWHFLPTSDKGYLINGVYIYSEGEVSGRFPYFIKINQNFEPQTDTIFGDYSSNSYYTDVQPVPNEEDYFYAFGTKEWHLGSGDVALAKIDQYGNRIWEKVIDIDDILPHDDFIAGEDQSTKMIQTLDGGFLLAVKTWSGYQAVYDGMVFLKLNSDREIEWVNEDELFYEEVLGDMYQLSDSTFICAGSYVHEGTIFNTDVQILKLDRNGNLLWERKYGDDFYPDQAYAMAITNNRMDGKDGFIMAGRAYLEGGPADALFIKTNCLGLLTEPQTSFSAEQDAENSLTYHFTNHSQYVYPDSIDGGHFLWDFGDGTTSEELHPSHTFAEKGESYIVTLTAVVCSDSSIMDIKIIAGEEIVGIEEVEGLPAFSFKLYPNLVSDGQLRVEYDLPKEGLLQLYDLQGKLMVNYQLLMVNDWVELDLGDFAEGMYLYRLVSDERTLKSGKVLCR